MKRIPFHLLVVVATLLDVTIVAPGARAASVGTGGYTNDFATQPAAADWSTFAIAGGAGDMTTAVTLDAAVQAVAAGSIAAQVQADPTNPPPILSTASFSESGLYLQTRPTGNGATLLMCTLVNNIGGNASAVTISYDFAKVAPLAEEIPGQRAYYSLTGAAGSWTVIPEFSSAVPGRLTANLNVTWPGGGNLYLLWADDNDSPSPDTACQIDNFSVTATPAEQTPAAITLQPQSQTVGELEPVTFTVGISGNPPPTLQWYTNNVPIPGATSPTYSVSSTPLHYSGLNFKVVAQNVASNVSHSATSSVAILTVNADTVRPVLLGAVASGAFQVVAAFSERLAAGAAASTGNYSVTGPGGSLIISNAFLDASQSNVVLTVTTLTPGANYTLTVNGVTDQSAAANAVVANSQASFTAATYTATDIGNPGGPGSATPAGSGFAVTGGGTNITGISDQFFFNWNQIAGDFDTKVRLDGLVGSDSWAKAGLMARESLAANSKHASTFATPSVSGTFFSYRSITGTNTTNSGFFPVAYPNTWLRLKRSGAVFTGYAGVDGSNWVQLGSATLTTPASLFYVGMAVTAAAPSNAPTATASAQFRDLGDASAGVVANVSLPFEPAGPSSRTTGLIISEIMYHPRPSNNLEFIEIFNAGLIPENIGGYRIAGDVDYTFAANTVLPVGAFLVVARNPGDVQAAYGISGVLGPWRGANTNALPDDAGTVRLRNRSGAVLLEINYEGQAPWPLAADGAGHSLVLARPSYGEADPRAWAISDRIGGSPGRFDAYGVDPLRNVVINEFLAHTDPPLEDFIELYNHSNQEVDISGAYLSDDRDTNKFRIPSPTIIPARGFVSFTVNTNTTGFALDSAGERIYLVNPSQTRVIDLVAFEAQANGVSSGRYADGAPGFHELASPTPGAANTPLLIRDVVINELMFNPISGSDDDEYVELYNRSGSPVNLSNWRFTAGINYVFPSNTFIPGNGYLVIAKNQANLLAKYPQLNAANTLGDYGGALANGGERVALSRPDVSLVMDGEYTNLVVSYVVVDETTYVDSGRWTRWADGGGSSLELIDANTDHRLAANWTDSDETAKSQWTNIVVTGLLDHNYPVGGAGATIDEIQVMILGAGEMLMDDLLTQTGTTGPNLVVNPNFNTGLNDWIIQGNHVRSILEPVGPNNPSQCMRIRATAGGDNGANRVECNVTPALAVNTTATIGGRFRWLRGFPIVLVRLHGGALEAVGTLPIPPDLGTPGQPNSRRVSNAGPAIYDVAHAPILPDANQPVVITARASDPNGIASVQLRFRLDPGTTINTTNMVDDGTRGDAIAGDGLYTVTLPGQTAGTLVAFRVAATDAAGAPASTLFPAASGTFGAIGEALIRFGEPPIFGNLGVYRVMMTSSNLNVWTTRERLSNEAMDGTFVYGNFRAIYNSGARYRGSPFTRNPSSPNGVGVAANYVWTLPDDEPLLGSDELNLDCLEPPTSSNNRDATALREITSFEMLNQMDLPFSYQRYVHIVINGVTSAGRNIPIYTDSQQPNGEYTAMWFPDDNDGDLFKIDDWFEFDDTPARLSNKSASLENFTTTGGVKKQARYRWSWEKKFNRGLNDDYSSLFMAVDALAAPDGSYIQQVEEAFEIREWLTMLAYRHVVGDWDGYGYQRGKNQFCYHLPNGKFWMLMWDLDFSLGCQGGHAPAQDLFTVSLGGAGGSDNMPEADRLYKHPHFRRMYYQALQQMAQGPMQDASFMPPLEARYRALLANGVTAITSPYVNSGAQNIPVTAWIQQRRSHILNNANGIAPYTNATFRVLSPLNVTTTNNLVTINGSAPFAVKDLLINGVVWPVTWTTVTGFTARIVVSAPNSLVQVVSRGFGANPAMSTQTVTINYTGPIANAADSLVFSEIMYNSTNAEASYVEILNRSSAAFDLSGWRVNGLDYTFPLSSIIAGNQSLALAKNAAAFGAAYGTNSTLFGQFDGNLDADGETLTLLKPGVLGGPEVVIDRVRYEPRLPWPTAANGGGSSLQLIDPAQDNSRPSNWSDEQGWQYVVYTGNIQGNPTNGSLQGTNFTIFLFNGGGDFYIDDVVLVQGTVPGVGPNLLQNGDFEAPMSGTWFPIGNHSGSVISGEVTHSGNGSMHVIGTLGGGPNAAVRQLLAGFSAPTNICTISYWFKPGTNGVTGIVRTFNGSAFDSRVSLRQSNFSPGLPNNDTRELPAYDPLWLNELQPENLTGPTDNQGEREPWIELYNAGATAIDLSTYYLANNYDTNLTQWPFPAGASIGAGEFKVVWADGQPGQTAGSALHTSFRLNAVTGSVALVRLVDARPQVTDYLTYSGVGAGSSYGDYPDGQPFNRVVMRDATPGGTNIARFVNLYINEWLAGNTNTLADPADGEFDDWFEIYNPGTNAVDLGGYLLTDNPGGDTNTYFRIPANGQYVVPANGFLLVWADNEPLQNAGDRPDLHVNFQLGKDGDDIALYAPDGRTLVDRVDFEAQNDDVAEGRYPDGAGLITSLSVPTPRGANQFAGNTPPQLAAIGDRTIRLGQTVAFTVTASDSDQPPQTLTYGLLPGFPNGASIGSASGQFTWTPSPAQAPSTNAITVRVTDNGQPPLSDNRSFTVTVLLPPKATIVHNGAGQITIGFDTVPGRTYQVQYKNDLNHAQWSPLSAPTVAPGTSLTVLDNIGAQSQRFYQIVQLD